MIFAFDHKIDFVLVCNVGNDFRISRYAVRCKVYRLAVHSPTVENDIGYG